MFKLKDILKAAPRAHLSGRQARTFKNISTDTRSVLPGDLFIPLQGDAFDGRTFIPEAILKGATVLETEDGLKALQNIAAFHRKKFKRPVIGVTGSAGKTTTKDMLASVLSQKFKTLKNEENFNNEIGVPKTLLKLTRKHRAAVIELAMQGLGEIAEIAEITSPTIAVVTNIGEAHMKQLKSKKNIAKAKSEVIDHVRPKGYVVLNADDEFYKYLSSRAKKRKLKVISFGIKNKADVTPKNNHTALLLSSLALPGKHNIYNALAAVAVAKILKLKDKHIQAGLKKFTPSTHRLQIFTRPDGVTIIDDTYNANPSSMRAALNVLASYEGRKIAVLGDMLELGPKSVKFHKEIGKFAAGHGIDILVGIGDQAQYIIDGANKHKLAPQTFHYKTSPSAAKKLSELIQPNDVILIKASRGLKLEKIVETLS
ncbi:MAG: UDP-N-acetylmuramoyl-tripeptide--D-alanyl-D-alanine ligase [Candidatus Margulisbacteria bacterium]|nr:UDP-N-acetylmuramoyl-tripeptide--D-alanyl-D-alanine ligase [Candidatus Margulisiibacteriota bacterium]MBU1021176.1 UDP-N-acetylmuramoyl-tripeptide--D-alanyl-D-alanine ligase [Candidatus Margulisiibacteriota bacterium]MBU1729782.1 UDP-N-acetylmuramoyl-tripeptide--D-alanyl-D-alanine ligase [Candidatus Margulisiibacteriota bacterium]MBU1955283.1 UDP-N-acetylmuramoyl-tripeptide--D-alanyl-D-alanine ligase [Candidatus Margulisiibacteriota bacterium]